MTNHANGELTTKEYLPIVASGSAIGKETRQKRGELLSARLLLCEQPERIEEAAVGEHLVVEVGAGCAASGTQAANQIAALNAVALMDLEAGKVSVARLESEPVVDDDEIAVSTLSPRVGHDAGGCRIDRLTRLSPAMSSPDGNRRRPSSDPCAGPSSM